MKNIDSLSKATVGPDYSKYKKIGIACGAFLLVCAVVCAFFVIRGNENVLLSRNHDDYSVEPEELVEWIMLDKESMVLDIDSEAMVTAVVEPSEFQNSIVWKSSDEFVAKVSNGRVTGVGPGIAAISAESKDGYCIAKCQVIVQKKAEDTEYEISEKAIALAPSDTSALAIYRLPNKSKDSTVYWKSSNDKVATVDSNGVVAAVNYGTTVISAMSRRNDTVLATCVVTVRSTLESVTLDRTSATISVGGTTLLTPNILPANTLNKKVTWESANKAIATVNSTGVVTGVKEGQTVITCTTVDGEVKATCNITVQSKVEKLTVSEQEVMMEINEKKTLTASIWPESLTEKGVTWSSSDSSVVSVDTNGSMMGINYGTAKITATAKADATIKGVCTVTVTRNVTGITLDNTSVNVFAGKTVTLKANVLPATTENRRVTWTSDNKAVATVDSNGVVTGVGAGTTTIHCKTNGGGFEATCKVSVSVPVSSVEFNKESITVTVGQTYGEELKYTVLPDTAKNSVKCYSNDSTIASVSVYDGKLTVKGVALGTTSIVVESTDGTGKKDTLTINVNSPGYTAFNTSAVSGGLQITGLADGWQNKFNGSSIALPDMIDGKKVTGIVANAFSNTLTGVTSVTGGNNITVIGAGAFANNPELKSIALSSSLRKIEENAFEGSGLESLTIPSSVNSIGEAAFRNCLSLESLTLGNGVTTIGDSAFCGAVKLVSVVLPASVKSIGEYSFYNTGLKLVTFNTTSLTTIPEAAFSMTNLITVKLPNGVTNISESAFAGNAKLKYLIMPDSVTTISGNAFNNCTGMDTIWLSESLASCASSAFNNVPDICMLAVNNENVRTTLLGAGCEETQFVYKNDGLYYSML